MTTPRRDPYDLLIQQFLQNIQQGSQAVERRFQGQREERLVGEERDFQTGLIEDERENAAAVRAEERVYQAGVRAEDRQNVVDDANRRWVEGVQLMEMENARADTVAARERSDRLREQAHQYRIGEAQNLRQLLAFLDPESAEYVEAEAVFNRLMEPISDGIPGEQALQNALSGVLVLEDGTRVNFHNLIGRYAYLARDAEADEAIRDAARQRVLDHLANPMLTPEQRTEYYDKNVAQNDLLFNDDSRRLALTLIGINDPQAQADALAARGLVQAQTTATLASADASRAAAAASQAATARTWFDLNEARRLSDLRYEEAQLIVAERRQAIQRSDLEIFLETGVIPTDIESANRLARSMRMTPEQLQVAGQARYKRLQAREEAALRLVQNQANLAGAQFDGAEIANLASQLEYDNEALFGAIRNRAGLAEVANAFAINGNVEGLRILESLSMDESFSDAFGMTDFGALIDIAEDVRLSDEEERTLARIERETDIAGKVLAYQTNRAAFLDATAETFLRGDFTVDENGEFSNLQADIREYVGNFSANQLQVMGTTAEDLARDLTRAVMRAKSIEDRGEAIGAMEVLIKAAPVAGPDADGEGRPTGPYTGELTAEQRAWRTTFLVQAGLAEVDPDVAELIADGVLRTGNLDYYTAMLDAEHVQSQINLNLANARRANIESDLLEQPEEGGVRLDEDMYSAMRLGLESMIGTVESRLSSAYCTVASPAGGQELNSDNAEECLGLVSDLQFYEYELRNLTHAFATQSPYSYGSFIGGMTTPVVRSAEVAETIEGWGDDVRNDYVEELTREAPHVLTAIYGDVGSGVIDSAEDMNAVMAEATQRLRDEGFARADATASISSIDFTGSEWANMSDGARLGRLARAPEWQNLAVEVASGRELTREEEDQLAVQFGWTLGRPIVGRTILGVEMPEWAQTPLRPDTESFRRALATTVQEINRQGDLTGAEGLGTPGGPALINGEVNPALMSALVRQESGNRHKDDDGNLIRSSAGALGITQVMPATALSPGMGVRPLIPEGERAELWRLYSIAQGTRSQQDYDAFVAEAEKVMAEIPESEFLRFGREYLGALLREFDGDVEKALAAYNAGAGNVRRAVRENPEGWLENLLPETQNYVPAIMGAFNRR